MSIEGREGDGEWEAQSGGNKEAAQKAKKDQAETRR